MSQSIGKPGRIGLLISPEYGYARQVTLGAGRALAGSRFAAHTRNLGFPISPDDVRSYAGLIGMVATPELSTMIRRAGVPCINVSRTCPTPELPVVSVDNVQVGRLVAEHLLERGHHQFIFVGMPRRLFSEERCRGFVERLREAGHEAFVTERPPDGAWFDRGCAQWSRPAGVFCCNDTTTRVTIDAITRGGLHVPNDFAVVGVDNDELECLTGSVPISSVDVRGEAVGDRAARLMMAWLGEGVEPPEETLLAPGHVVVRASSDITATDDPVVLKTIAAMQERGHRDFSLKEIEELVGLSRRTIERAFRDRFGCTPAKELERLRLERATALLLDTRLTSAEIAERVGFVSEQRMRRVFLRRFGMSPLQYRRKYGT